MVLIARIFVFAFLVACMAAATAVMVAFLTLDQTDFTRLTADPEAILAVIGLSSVLFALLPFMLVVALAEGFRLRSSLFCALAGGALALVLIFVSNSSVHDRESRNAPA